MAVALEAKSAAHRDVLFACGSGLVSLGLFPFLHARYASWFPGVGATSEHADGRHPQLPTSALTHTAFDLATCGFAAAFALLGVGVLSLSCLLLPRRSTRACLKTVGVPLAVVAAGAAMLAYSYCTDAELAAPWRASVQREFAFDDDESGSGERRSDSRVLEFQVNKHFCRALGDRVCLDGRLREAQELFATLPAWPAAADPLASVAAVCFEAAAATDVERLATAAADAELRVCRVCSSVTRSASRRRPNMLELIRSPSRDAVRWCGEYLLTWRGSANLTSAPFRQHREEVVRKWRGGDGSAVEDEDAEWASPLEAAMTRSVRLLLVLVWFSLPALAIMARWYAVPEREQWDWRVAVSA